MTWDNMTDLMHKIQMNQSSNVIARLLIWILNCITIPQNNSRCIWMCQFHMYDWTICDLNVMFDVIVHHKIWSNVWIYNWNMWISVRFRVGDRHRTNQRFCIPYIITIQIIIKAIKKSWHFECTFISKQQLDRNGP